MCDRNKLGPLSQAFFEVIKMKRARVVHRSPDQFCALFLTNEMPGHYVGMMFHNGEDNLVTLFNVVHAPTIGNRINAFG